MDERAAFAFLGRNHRAVLCTRSGGGRLHVAPVLCGLERDALRVSTVGSSAKVRNLRRDPRVTLCVLADDFFSGWLRVEGRAEVVELPAAMDGLVSLYRQVAGEHPDWDDFRAAMERDGRVLLHVAVDSVGPGSV